MAKIEEIPLEQQIQALAAELFKVRVEAARKKVLSEACTTGELIELLLLVPSDTPLVMFSPHRCIQDEFGNIDPYPLAPILIDLFRSCCYSPVSRLLFWRMSDKFNLPPDTIDLLELKDNMRDTQQVDNFR